jgi:hypothetical protein
VSQIIGGVRLAIDPAGSLADLGSDADALQIYNSGQQTDGLANQYFDVYSNLIQDTDKIAFMKAQQSVFQDVQNDSVQSVATTNAENAVSGYYEVHQLNLYDRWDLLVAGIESYGNQADSISYDAFETDYSKSLTDGEIRVNSVSKSYGTKTVNLVSGNTTTVRTITYTWDWDWYHDTYERSGSPYTTSLTIDPTNPKKQVEDVVNDNNLGDETATFSINRITLLPPSSDYDQRNILSTERFSTYNDQLTSQHTEIRGSVSNFVSGTYSDLEAGTLDITDTLGTYNTVFNYLPEASGENTTFSKGSGYLAAAGFDSVDYQNTSYMNVSLTPQFDPNRTLTREGFLLSRFLPSSGNWTYGTTYNATAINGTQMFSTIDGQTYIIAANFTIHGAFNANGEAIDASTIDTPDEENYRVSNTSELQKQIVELSETIQEINNRTTDDSGTGPAGGGGSGESLLSLLGLSGVLSSEMLRLTAVIFVALVLLMGAVYS